MIRVFLDTEGLISLRKQYPCTPIIGYLKLNLLRNKADGLRGILKHALIDILCIDDTKLEDSFPESQFQMEGYQFPLFRRDRNNTCGGKIVFLKEGLLLKNRLKSIRNKSF